MKESLVSLRRAYVLATCACALGTLLYALLQSYPELLYGFSNTVSIAFSLIPLVLAAYSLSVHRDDRWFRRLDAFLFVGFLLWFIGEFTWGFYALYLGVEIPYPSLADVFWLVAYPFVLMGTVSFVYPFRSAIRRRNIIPSLAVSALATLVVGVVLVLPTLSFSEDTITNIVSLSYPILDIVFLFVSITGVTLFWGGRIARAWYWFTAGAGIMAIGDILFSYAVANGTYYSGDPLDLLYVFSYTCYGLALHQNLRGILQ